MPVHGWVFIDKPVGMTSNHVLSKMKRALSKQKMGHAGTLDPAASGILAVALGEATKTSSLIMNSSKTYEFDLVWGAQTTTDDEEGDVIATNTLCPSQDAVQAILPQFCGQIVQVPPRYSAIKMDGKRAYQRARQQEDFDLPERQVEIHAIRLLEYCATYIRLEVTCHAGTYMRSLARDMALQLGTVGHARAIRRTKLGKITIKHTILLEKFIEMVHNNTMQNCICPIDDILDDILVTRLSAEQSARMRHGHSILWYGEEDVAPVLCMDTEGTPIALAALAQGYLKPYRIFNI